MTKIRRTRPDEIVFCIAQFTAAYGYPPSIREIMPRVGLASTSAVDHHLRKLVREGRIEYSPRTSRSLRVLPTPTPDGICARPGCNKTTTGTRPNTKWCSKSCTAVAAHVRRWLRDTGHEYLIDQLGLTA